MKTCFRTLLWLLLLLLLLGGGNAALGEIGISFSPESPRVGDYVDVTVTPDREGAKQIIYELSTPDERVFKGKEDTHFTASFRPRQEAVYTLKVTVIYGKKDQETASVTIPVQGAAPLQQGPEVIYSQKDGWWKKSSYGSSTLEKAGCAIFTLSHAIQRLGFEGEDVLPNALGKKYANCLVKGGTANERLLTFSGSVYDFVTQDDLNESARDIAACLRMGDFFSFSIVIGHIALANGLSEDGTKVHIVDSAPSATFERIKNGTIYYQAEDGSFVPVDSPEALPGARWFFETQHCSGMEYWLDLSYCAKRGMRLIRPQWLKLATADGLRGVSMDQIGSMQCKVLLGEETLRVNTSDLRWACIGSETPQIAVVNKKSGTVFRNGDGDKIAGFKTIQTGTLLLPLRIENDSLYVYYKGVFGYVAKNDVDLLALPEAGFQTGIISLNGKTAGTATVKVRSTDSAKGRVLAEWKLGTPVAVAQQKGDFFLVEGKGLRGWIHEKYLTLNETTETEGAEN